MPHLNLASGVPTVVPSGVLVGATDFREFSVGVGLPAGISEFGDAASRPDPNLVSIGNDGAEEVNPEGNHFAMTGRGGANWGYGLDSFFGQMDRGELRAVVRSDFRGGFEDFPIGAAAGMQGANNTDWRAWIGTQFLRGGVNDIESSGKTTFVGFGNTMFGLMAADLQQPFQAGINVNVRIRRVANPGDPANRDDWEIRSWYGTSPGAEPVLPDAIAVNQARFDPSLQAIGWGQLPQAPFNPVLQKIRFLSFSVNPLVEPAPSPSDIAPVSPWVPSGNQLPIATDWTGQGGGAPVTATKPIIASPAGEWDARSLVLGDLATVATWPDVSPGGSNDLSSGQGTVTYQAAGGAGQPWSPLLPAVLFDNVPQLDSMSLASAFGTSGTPMTIFVVAQVTQLSPTGGGGGMSFFGTTDGINPPVGVYLFVAPDGSVWYSLGRNGGVTGSNTRTGPGVVSPGDRVIITARREEFPQNVGVFAGPTILRVNGVEVASDLGSGWVDFWFQPHIHRGELPSTGIYPDSVDGEDGLIAHMFAFNSAASDAEILQMEAYLGGVWGFNFGTQWTPILPPVDTTWTPS